MQSANDSVTRRKFLSAGVFAAAGVPCLHACEPFGQAIDTEASSNPAGPQPPHPLAALFQNDSRWTAIPWLSKIEHLTTTIVRPPRRHGDRKLRRDRWALRLDGTVLGTVRSTENVMLRIADMAGRRTLGVILLPTSDEPARILNRYGDRLPLTPDLSTPDDESKASRVPLYVSELSRPKAPSALRSERAVGFWDRPAGRLLDDAGNAIAEVAPTKTLNGGDRGRELPMLLDTSSVAGLLLTSNASPRLGETVERMLAAIRPTSLPAKWLRSELGMRLIQIELLTKNADVLLRTGSAGRSTRAAQTMTDILDSPIRQLRRLDDAANAALILDAIANIDPRLRLFAEGVRRAGHHNDAELLMQILVAVKSTWDRWRSGPSWGFPPIPIRSDPNEPIDFWMRAELAFHSRYAAIRAPDDAVAFASECEIQPNANRHVQSQFGDPVTLRTSTLNHLHAMDQIGPFDVVAHQAAALQQAGYDVDFRTIAARRTIDAETKTIVQDHPLILARHQQPTGRITVVCHDAQLPDGGRTVGPGVYEYDSDTVLDDFLARYGRLHVPMQRVPAAHGSLHAWSRFLDEAMRIQSGGKPSAKEAADPDVFHTLMDFRETNPWAAFTEMARQSHLESARNSFARVVKDNGAQVVVMLIRNNEVDDYRIYPAARLADRKAPFVLNDVESLLGRLFQIVPQKMYSSIRDFHLDSRIIRTSVSYATVENGRVKRVTGELPLHGRASATRIMVGPTTPKTAAHELGHVWSHHHAETQREVEDQRLQIVDLFYNISWTPERPARLSRGQTAPWYLRSGDRLHLPEFGRVYGATNQDEDFAVTVERYVAGAREFRDSVRRELRQRRPATAAKYLYLKELTFLDTDGVSIEYDLASGERPVTYEEFESATRRLLDPETERLREICRRIHALSQESRRTGNIT